MPILIIIVTVFVIWGVFVYRAKQKKSPNKPVGKATTGVFIGLFLLAVIIIALTLIGRLPWLFGVLASSSAVLMKIALGNKLKIFSIFSGLLGFILKRRKPLEPPTNSPTQITDNEGIDPLGRQVSGALITLYLPGHPNAVKGEHGMVDASIQISEQGQELSLYSTDQYLELFNIFREQDAFSAELLSHYLTTRFGDEWKQQCDTSAPALEQPITDTSAHHCLGTQATDTPEKIDLSYQRLRHYFGQDALANQYILEQLKRAYRHIQ